MYVRTVCRAFCRTHTTLHILYENQFVLEKTQTCRGEEQRVVLGS